MTTCPECNDTGERDSGGTHPWGEPVYLPCDCKNAEIGRRWHEDSSLEKWFPLTAERLAALEAENATLKEQAAEIDRLRTTLAMVADIAHSGGLAQHNDFTALTAIRRLTLDAWNRHGTTDEHRERVHEAGREAVRRSGA